MAITYAAIGAEELTYLAADKPIFVYNAINENTLTQTSTVSPTYKWTTNGQDSSGDDSETGYPANRAADGYNHLRTRPATASATVNIGGADYETHYFNMNLDRPNHIDFVMITGHNFGDIWANGAGTPDLIVELQSDEVAAFDDTGGYQRTLYKWTVTSQSNDRLIAWTFDTTHGSDGTSLGNYRINGGRYFRLRIRRALAGGNLETAGSVKTSIGELFLGTRQQMKHKSNIPFDDLGLMHNIESNITRGGVSMITKWWQGQKILNSNITLADTTHTTKAQEFWKYVGGPEIGGVFCYCENPQTYPNETHLMVLDNMDSSFAVQGYTEREFHIEAHEQGPEKYFLWVEQYSMVT